MDPRGKNYGLTVGRGVVQALGGGWTAEKQRFFDAWARAEGTDASYNPFATTKKGYQGETQFNSVGVKNYPNLQTGIRASMETLTNGYYDHIVSLLRSDNATAKELAQAVMNSPWGTGAGVLRVLGVKNAADYEKAQSAATFGAKRGVIQQSIASVGADRAALLQPSQAYLNMLNRSPQGKALAATAGATAAAYQTKMAQMPQAADGGTPAGFQPTVAEMPTGGSPYEGVLGAKFSIGDGPEQHQARALTGWESDHAWDMMVPVGTPIYAKGDGVIGDRIGVQSTRPNDGARLTLNGAKNAWWYGHMSKIIVKPGQKVRAGQLLGYSGASENGAAHLHFAQKYL